MSTFDTLFPIPSGGRNADDMGMPPDALDATPTATTGADMTDTTLCQHKRYSVDTSTGAGNCSDCGAAGRMRFVVGDPVAAERERHRSEIARLLAHIEKVEAWHRSGEKLLHDDSLTGMFSLGGWWADRPWRVRPGASPP